MDSTLNNEELAEKIRNGDTSLIPLLWGKCRRTVMIMAAKYRGVMEKNAFVDMEDFIQCGYFAMLAAVEAYDPEKGYKFSSYMNYKYKKQVYEMFGNVREGDKRIFPAAASSLNVTLENDGHETELIDMLEDKNAERIETDYEKKELQQIVRDAVAKLPERERYVIQERYFNEREKVQIADGKRYKDGNDVTRIEDRALRMLRRDKALQALHAAYFKTEPRKQDIFKASPESAVIAGENWDKWFDNIMEDIRGFENEL
ncbi:MULTISPECIES: sigma-70 family RNA polymerase sigma factor [Eisenbergiella]|uniref:sigma-70 family RNA polymerase sigma factor n=1 Tax=Eisenbergiella TaxID=1432051 RepID=UPI0023F16B59|nr:MULTISPECIES: sigma-70 family RNA polymerase sigma factor [Eisenbergiella]MCI6706905.1 sigma-70 family RNA polymerase sigma factor [Eisenbergiella massiliensis]MDY5527842.1 sigma-70 family RNA polymerase sigma factor [Eisenbergiella porci]